MTRTEIRSVLLMLLGIVLLIGCVDKDGYQKAAQVAEKAADRQAQQNTEMARVNREVAEGTRRMVEADAVARKEIIEVHQDIQAERVTLNDSFDALESERQQIAAQRRTESMLVPVAKAVGIALVAVVVVGFCWTLLFGLRSSNATDAELAELLIHDLVRDEPRLLYRAAEQVAIEDQHPNRNPDPLLLGPEDDLADEAPKQGEEH